MECHRCVANTVLPISYWTLLPNTFRPHLFDMVLLSVSQNGAIARRNDGLEYYATLSVFWGASHRGNDWVMCDDTLHGTTVFLGSFQEGY